MKKVKELLLKFLDKISEKLTFIEVVAIIVMTIALLVLLWFWGVVLFRLSPTSNMDTDVTSSIGSFVGGIFGTIFSLVAILLYWSALKVQQKDLKETIAAANNTSTIYSNQLQLARLNSLENTYFKSLELYKNENDHFLKNGTLFDLSNSQSPYSQVRIIFNAIKHSTDKRQITEKIGYVIDRPDYQEIMNNAYASFERFSMLFSLMKKHFIESRVIPFHEGEQKQESLDVGFYHKQLLLMTNEIFIELWLMMAVVNKMEMRTEFFRITEDLDIFRFYNFSTGHCAKVLELIKEDHPTMVLFGYESFMGSQGNH